jgi:hypothetical protein
LSGLAQENASMLECLSSPEVFEGLQALAEKSGTRESEIDLIKTIREMQ